MLSLQKRFLIINLIIFFLAPLTYSATVHTPKARIQIEKFGNNYSEKNIGFLREIYKGHLKEADFKVTQIDRDISYGPHPLQNLNIHYTNKANQDKSPIVIFFHGGAFIRGDKSDGVIFDNVLNYFSRNGIVGINANYRLAPQYKWPSGAEDIASIIRWIKTNAHKYNLNPNKIFLMGHSAGAAHIATYSFSEELQIDKEDGVKGAILLSGIYSNSNANSRNVYYGKDLDLAQTRMPINAIDGRNIPLFVITAEFDRLGTQKESLTLIRRICDRDKKCPRHKQIPGHNHYSMMYHFNTLDDSIAYDILDFVLQKNLE